MRFGMLDAGAEERGLRESLKDVATRKDVCLLTTCNWVMMWSWLFPSADAIPESEFPKLTDLRREATDYYSSKKVNAKSRLLFLSVNSA